MTEKFCIQQIAPELPHVWAATEIFYWNQEVIDILKEDVGGKLLEAAYDSVDWEGYYERLKGTPFYDWKKWGTGFLSLGGSAHIEENNFFEQKRALRSQREIFFIFFLSVLRVLRGYLVISKK